MTSLCHSLVLLEEEGKSKSRRKKERWEGGRVFQTGPLSVSIYWYFSLCRSFTSLSLTHKLTLSLPHSRSSSFPTKVIKIKALSSMEEEEADSFCSGKKR